MKRIATHPRRKQRQKLALERLYRKLSEYQDNNNVYKAEHTMRDIENLAKKGIQ